MIKKNADTKMRAKVSELQVNNWVLYQRTKGKIYDKSEPLRDISRWRVDEVKGSMVTAESSSGDKVTRNSSCFKKVESSTGLNQGSLSQDHPNPPPQSSEINVQEPGELRRSSRSTKGTIDKLQVNFGNKSYNKL